MTRKKFRSAQDSRVKSTNDDIGKVVIKIFLAKSGHIPIKGNIMKTISLEECKVSEVHEAIQGSIVSKG